uniref:Uncharacterized protein n=1 Tax=Hordeum vulgare subsp. vulgare TaxID=112509 RepID=A0A8I6YHR3_HORVV
MLVAACLPTPLLAELLLNLRTKSAAPAPHCAAHRLSRADYRRPTVELMELFFFPLFLFGTPLVFFFLRLAGPILLSGRP